MFPKRATRLPADAWALAWNRDGSALVTATVPGEVRLRDARTGEPLGPAIVWQCHRSAPFCQELSARGLEPLLRERTGRRPQSSRHLPEAGPGRAPSFRRCLGDKAAPSAAEISGNPRARSARLRGAERSEAPAWGAFELTGGAGGSIGA